MPRLIMILVAFVTLANANYYPSRFEDGFTFSATETCMYSAPWDSTSVVATIPAGELIEITEFAEITFYADSCDWGWYLAEYREENTIFRGYVQDRNLAFASIALGVDTLLVFRLTAFNTVDNAYEGQLSVIVSGEAIFQEDYRPHWTPWGRMFDYDVEFSHGSADGFTGVKNVILLYFGLDVSGVESRQDLLVWTEDNQLVPGACLQ